MDTVIMGLILFVLFAIAIGTTWYTHYKITQSIRHELKVRLFEEKKRKGRGR